jgi:hypothetical protein
MLREMFNSTADKEAGLEFNPLILHPYCLTSGSEREVAAAEQTYIKTSRDCLPAGKLYDFSICADSGMPISTGSRQNRIPP